MDCGPAALAALLGAHGLVADVDALRDVCATDVDGTSVDDLEDVASGLGLDAEQVMVPWGQVSALPELYLPAIVLTLTPDGYVHFVVVWRIARGRVDVVDPAVGRRRVKLARFAREILTHEVVVPVAGWAEYAAGEDARRSLIARLRAAGRSAEQAQEDLDAALADGPVAGIGRLLGELGDGDGGVAVADAGFDESGGALVRVRGAVLVRAPGRRDVEVPAAWAGVLGTRRRTPLGELRGVLWVERRAIGCVATLAALAGAAGVAEALVARDVLERGLGDGRLLALMGVLAAGMVAVTGAWLLALSVGRRVERRVREQLLARVARLGDRYVRSRPPGDLAERGHAVVLVRAAVELGALAVQRAVELVVAAAAIVVLARPAWPVALGLLAAAALGPALLARHLAEHDLRARTAHGALSLQVTDALRAADALAAHPAARGVLRALHAPLVELWARATGAVQARLAAAVLTIEAVGAFAVGGAVALAVHSGASDATVLVVGVLAFLATAALQDLLMVARQVIPVRNALGRVLEPLSVPAGDPPPQPASARGGRGVHVSLEEVRVRLGASTVLDDVSVQLRPGEHVAVVGASGAGKSSLVAALAGWLVPDSGRLRVDERALVDDVLGELRAELAWADTTTRIFDASLEDNAGYGAAPGAPPASDRLRAVGLADAWARLGDRAVGQDGRWLSDAERQRLVLARALGRPAARLVLLDEALGALPTAELRRVLSRVRATWRHATLVHVTHDARSALDFGRVLVVEDGRVVQDDHPAALRRETGGRFATLLADQQRLAARMAPTGPAAPAAAAPEDGTAPRQRLVGLLRGRAILAPLAAALAAGAAGSVATVVAADRLGSALAMPDASQLSWLPGVVGMLGVAALATGAVVFCLGVATVALGRRLRERALAGAGARRGGVDVARAVGRVLDLEQFESMALGSGMLLALAVVEAAVAAGVLVYVGQPAAVAVLAALLALTIMLARGLARAGRNAARARAAVTGHFAGRLLALRTVTVQEDPDAERAQRQTLLDEVQHTHARVDRRRVVLAAVLPRAGAIALLAAVALAPPSGAAARAGVLGAALVLLGALERAGQALANLAPGLAAADGARDLLESDQSPTTPHPAGVLRVPAARPGHVLHQPLAANALLATGTWPPTDEHLQALHARLAEVGLDGVLARMPMGLGQPLGETGWRLSQGERARLVVVPKRPTARARPPPRQEAPETKHSPGLTS
jgi:ABC-type multidrug transport system fused ATPase/permease subunit